MRIFTVISPHPRDYNSIELQVLDYFKDKTFEAYIVKETGKTDSHPHLNVIWTTNLHQKYFSQKLRAHFKAAHSNERLLKHKTVFNEDGLRNTYLQKETNAKVLYDWQNAKPTHDDYVKIQNDLYDELRQLKREKLKAMEQREFIPYSQRPINLQIVNGKKIFSMPNIRTQSFLQQSTTNGT
jgi:hypothetical protein